MRSGMRRLIFVASMLSASAIASGGCAVLPGAPNLGLQRSLYPGLGDLDERGIASAMAIEVDLVPPVSGGLVWVNEGLDDSPEAARRDSITEYARTGVLDEALGALREEPFDAVAVLPTLPAVAAAPVGYSANGESAAAGTVGPETIDRLRSASAKFQYDVAILLQTGTAEDRGFNVAALGYLGLVTLPLFPGLDLAASSSAELCAVDVRTGVMLGCARGRSQEMDRFLFTWQRTKHRDRLVERTLRRAVESAAADLRLQLAMRMAAR
jgi:hypothetical protein